MPEKSLKEKTAKGLFWGGFSNIIQQIVGAIFCICIAKILDPADYGLIGMLSIFIAIANVIMSSGFGAALVNKKKIEHDDYNAVFWFSVITGIILYLLLFYAAPLIADFYGQPLLINLSRLLFLSILINSCGLTFNAMLLKKMMVKERAIISVFSVLVSGAIGLILALNGFAYWGLAIQSVSMSLTSVILRWYFTPWKPSIYNISLRPLKTMIGFSFKLFLTMIVYQININILSIFYGRSYGKTITGLYSQGNKWSAMGLEVTSGMIEAVAQPVFVEVNDDKERHLQVFRKMLRFGAFISFPCLFGLAFIASEFVPITVGDKYLGSIPFMQLFCIWMGCSYLLTLYYQLLISYGKSNIVLYCYIGITLLSILGILLFKQFGVLPVAIGYVIINFINIFVFHYFCNKIIGIKLRHLFKDVIPYFSITLVCIAVAWALTWQIENIYLLCIAKIAIVAILYFLIAKFSGSMIMKESIDFFTSRMRQK